MCLHVYTQTHTHSWEPGCKATEGQYSWSGLGGQRSRAQAGSYLPAVLAEHRRAAQEAWHLPTEQTLGEAIPHHVAPHGVQPLHQPPAAQGTGSDGMCFLSPARLLRGHSCHEAPRYTKPHMLFPRLGSVPGYSS